MTTYVPILDTQLDPDAPLTSQLMYQMRDNALAIAESDTSVPLAVRIDHKLVGTMVTTSGTAVTLSGLDLTKFRFLKFVLSGVSFSGNNVTLSIGGASVVFLSLSGDQATGIAEVDLFNGNGFSVSALESRGLSTSITNASTSVSATASSSAFDAGSIRVYGIK